MIERMIGSDTPSTLGGDGWIPRVRSHQDEVEGGRVWTRCGYRSEFTPLRAVLLARPPDSLASVQDAGVRLMLHDVDLGAMRAQAETIGEAYRRNEVEVHVMHPPPSAPPNIIFMRDLFFMTPGGAVLGRMASQQRAGEERHVAHALAWAGFPILRTVTGSATFEGADALWLDDETVVIGVGFRTNGSGAEVVQDVLWEQHIRAVTVPLGAGVQHLLGSMAFLDERLVAIHSAAVGDRLRGLLRERDYELIEFESTAELLIGRGMNVVTIAPRHVLMLAGAPSIRRRLESFGVEVEEIETGEYLKAAGGIGCLTGILRRE